MSKFANACRMSYEEWVATIPEELPEPEYSKKHIRRMNALMNKMRGNVYHHFTTRTIKVMLVAAVLFALLLTAFVVPSSREFIIDNLGIYSTYQLTEDNGNSVSGEITVGYVPEGYELENEEKYNKYLISCYLSQENKRFTIHKYPSSMKINFDTENADAVNIIIDNITYTYYESSSGNHSIMWQKNDYIFQVDGPLSKDELLKIAETVK